MLVVLALYGNSVFRRIDQQERSEKMQSEIAGLIDSIAADATEAMEHSAELHTQTKMFVIQEKIKSIKEMIER